MFFLGLPQGPVAEVKSGSTRSPRTCCFASWKKFMNRFRMTGCFAYLLRVTSKTRLGLEELGPRQQSDVSHRFGRRLASTTLKPCFFGHFVGGVPPSQNDSERQVAISTFGEGDCTGDLPGRSGSPGMVSVQWILALVFPLRDERLSRGLTIYTAEDPSSLYLVS